MSAVVPTKPMNRKPHIENAGSPESEWVRYSCSTSVSWVAFRGFCRCMRSDGVVSSADPRSEFYLSLRTD